MRHDASNEIATRTVITEIETGYDAARARVDKAYQRMREIEAAQHAAADARTTSYELFAALRQATAMAASALRLLDARTPAPRRGLHRHPKATRSVPADVAAWSAELVRLTQIGVWLRRTTLDDPGVHVPATVRVANYAATGPHTPGLEFEAEVDARSREARIGVDLQMIVDRERAASGTPSTSPDTDDVPITGTAVRS